MGSHKRVWRLSLLKHRDRPAAACLSLGGRPLGLASLLACVVACVTVAPTMAAEACPNEQLRSKDHSTLLPDCRAYELVAPPYKEGALVSATSISEDGSHVLGLSFGAFAGTENVPGLDAGYDFTRAAGVSWMSSPLDPPASLGYINHLENSFEDVSVDFGRVLFPDVGEAPHPGVRDIYIRESDGAFVEVGPELPPISTENRAAGEELGADAYRGASSDLSHVFFSVHDAAEAGRDAEEKALLWPGDDTVQGTSLYEYVGTGHAGIGSDVPALVGVDNTGHQISQCGTSLGATRIEPKDAYNAVSRSGEMVFFTARPGGCENEEGTEIGTGPAVYELYARVGPQPASATTVNIAGSSGCAISASCNVTSEVTYQGASEDGSKVFFTAEQAGLVAGNEDGSNVLYECELPGDGGVQPRATGAADPCPSLKAISVTGNGEGANVLGVARVSEDGSHVYFVASGVLATNSNGQSAGFNPEAQAGADNLYVYEPNPAHPGQYETEFVAMLCSGHEESGAVPDARCQSSESDEADWQREDSRPVEATSDGNFLLFASFGDLTSDDSSTARQLFRYDAQAGELVRVSAGQKSASFPAGFNGDGNTTAYPASFPTQGYAVSSNAVSAPPSMSSEGSDPYVFFESSDGLTPQALNAQQIGEGPGGEPVYAENVYEYHDGNVSLISDGQDLSRELNQTSAVRLDGTDASGSDVFFSTSDSLVGQDTDTGQDIYDARIDGGFPAPVVPAGCAGDACQGPRSAPPLLTSAGSVTQPGGGNVVSKPETKPAVKPKPKSLTRAQKLANALKTCRSKARKKRAACESQSRKRYGSSSKARKTERGGKS
jgi:hypothetical protein